MSQFGADGIGKGDVGHYAFAEKSIYTMAGAIEELIRDYEIKRLVFFLQRSDCGNGDDPLDAELLESINIGAEIQFRGEDAMSASVARQKSDLAAFERAQDIGVGRVAEWSLLLEFPHVGEAGHGIKPAAADDANFCVRQRSPERFLQ